MPGTCVNVLSSIQIIFEIKLGPSAWLDFYDNSYRKFTVERTGF